MAYEKETTDSETPSKKRTMVVETQSKISPQKKVRRKLVFNEDAQEETDKEGARFDLLSVVQDLQARDRRKCIDRYNFDPVLEVPMKGPYVWQKTVHVQGRSSSDLRGVEQQDSTTNVCRSTDH